jgi:Zn-dependent protease with chaperone function
MDPEEGLAALARAPEEPDALPAPAAATASLFIVNPLSGTPGCMTLLSTHPPMEQRTHGCCGWRDDPFAWRDAHMTNRTR